MPPTVATPAVFLATRNRQRATSPLYLLTGKKGSGKTSWCRGLVAVARGAGYRVRGVLSEPVYASGGKVAIDLVDVAGGERRRLAGLRACSGALTPKPGCDGDRGSPRPAAGRWTFDPAVIAWGNELLRPDTPCDLLVVDELGPLEFSRGGGLQAGLAALAAGRYRLGVVVIRPSLIPAARGRWPRSQTVSVEAVR